MIYSYDIITPVGVTQAAPLRTRLKVTKGLVYRVEIEFPPGPLSLLHVAIFDGGFQLWPTNPDYDFHGDNGFISFEETYLKSNYPYEFIAQTWNEDETWDHTITIRLGMVSEEVYMARFLPTVSYDKMLEVLAQLEAKQEAERKAIIAEPLLMGE